jgi:hypothetical protein
MRAPRKAKMINNTSYSGSGSNFYINTIKIAILKQVRTMAKTTV